MSTLAARWVPVTNRERKSTGRNARGDLRVMDVSAAQQQHLQPSGVVLQQLHSPPKVELDVGRRCNLSRNDLQPARHVSITGSMSRVNYGQHVARRNQPQVNCTRSRARCAW